MVTITIPSALDDRPPVPRIEQGETESAFISRLFLSDGRWTIPAAHAEARRQVLERDINALTLTDLAAVQSILRRLAHAE